MVKIRKIKLEDKEEILKMFKEYEESEIIPGIDRYEGIRNFENLKYKTFEEWIKELKDEEDESKVPEEFSPQSVYVVINNKEEIIGLVNIRWKPVKILVTFGGFIGYSIRPSKRGQGYAYYMLKAALEEMWKAGKTEVLISCKDFNIMSKNTIEKNGGKYLSTYFNEDDGYNHLRYCIKKEDYHM